MHKIEKYIEYKYDDTDNIIFPYMEIKGEKEGPRICIVAGIHGCEYPAIAAAIALYKELKPEMVKGTIKIIPLADMAAFETRSMFVCPKDKKNVNRCFTGNLDGSYSEVLTHYLFNDFIKESDYFVDLHSADLTETMISFCEIHESDNNDVNDMSLKMARYSGISDIVIKSSKGEINDRNQSYSSAADIGIPSLVMNAGQTNEDIKVYIDVFLAGLYNVLAYLNFIDEEVIDYNDYICYKAPVHIRASTKGLFYCDYGIGDKVEEGDVLGKIEDIFGKTLDIVKAPVGGKILLVNKSLPVKKDTLIVEIIVKSNRARK